MTRLKLLSAVLAVAAAAALVTGSAGFSSVSAERGVSVTVVEDDQALVNVEACYTSASPNQGNQSPVKVRVTNQLPTALTIEHVNGESVPPGRETVAPGGQVVVNQAYDSPMSEVTVELESDGGTGVTLTRTVVQKSNCPFRAGNGGNESNDGDDDAADDSHQSDDD
ncbi:hypothetical protein [Haloarchaeobius iranensis]|uniref:Uncharacterized protein n=1 Tax=Haloarchaeobius iranensis TaxID=996166 RepID=A0A1G9XXT4_9EURY|nr:hypothetical protein [Haloarchaeobius iranensis]SDN01587.1 hypothetical protein SAMN05192554_11233 [Haloarchaeobius iranensis]